CYSTCLSYIITTIGVIPDDQHLIYVGQGGGDGWCTQDEFHLSFRAGGPINFSDCSGGGQVDNRLWDIVAVPPVQGQWYHVAITWKAEEFARLYVDGALGSQKAPLPEFVSETWEEVIYIGRPAANKRFFGGAIDELAIFNTALDEEDIQDIMNQGLEKALGVTGVSSTGKLGATWGQLKVQY
ncbi:LamG domain-containing protein, partial [Candidatus Poribacteria bacterium]